MTRVLQTFNAENLYVRVFDSRISMGREAAREASDSLRRLLDRQDTVRVMFAAAPSQNEFLDALVAADGIDWSRVHAFHMDEYIGLDPDHPAGFVNFLEARLFSRLPFGQIHRINGQADDPQAEAERYAALLAEQPVDLVFLGVGENGHIAFNDPPVADFDDPLRVKIVELDRTCRQQQVNDGCFASFDTVPTHALTVTIPTMLEAGRLLCIVPARSKADAIVRMLTEDPNTGCPATILKTHPDARLYLDPDSASLLDLD